MTDSNNFFYREDSNSNIEKNESFQNKLFNINISQIQLTDSPLDDYQRLIFATALCQKNIDSIDLKVDKTQYKSKLVEQIKENYHPILSPKPKNFTNINVANGDESTLLITNNNHVENSFSEELNNTLKKKNEIKYQNKTKNILRCFEYHLPDLLISEANKVKSPSSASSSASSSTSSSPSTSPTTSSFKLLDENIREKLCLNNKSNNVLKGEIILPDNDKYRQFGNIKATYNNRKNSQTSSKFKSTHKATLEKDSSTSATSANNSSILSTSSNKTSEDSSFSDKVGSILINQNGKVIDFRQDNELNTKKHLINPNNIVIWSKDFQFVFISGIWKLYQDVMNGLININRSNYNRKNQMDQAVCYDEFKLVFYNLLGNSNFLEKDNELTNFSNINLNINRTRTNSNGKLKTKGKFSKPSSCASNNSQTNPNFNTKYHEFNWNSLHENIQNEVVVSFKQYLFETNQCSLETINNIIDTKMVQKVKGGFIKLQGTWLPIEISRVLCIFFAYPIRYLLIPIFGPKFPKDCEDWFQYRGHVFTISNSKIHRPIHVNEIKQVNVNDPQKSVSANTINHKTNHNNILTTPNTSITSIQSTTAIPNSNIIQSSNLSTTLSQSSISPTSINTNGNNLGTYNIKAAPPMLKRKFSSSNDELLTFKKLKQEENKIEGNNDINSFHNFKAVTPKQGKDDNANWVVVPNKLPSIGSILQKTTDQINNIVSNTNSHPFENNLPNVRNIVINPTLSSSNGTTQLLPGQFIQTVQPLQEIQTLPYVVSTAPNVNMTNVQNNASKGVNNTNIPNNNNCNNNTTNASRSSNLNPNSNLSNPNKLTNSNSWNRVSNLPNFNMNNYSISNGSSYFPIFQTTNNGLTPITISAAVANTPATYNMINGLTATNLNMNLPHLLTPASITTPASFSSSNSNTNSNNVNTSVSTGSNGAFQYDSNLFPYSHANDFIQNQNLSNFLQQQNGQVSNLIFPVSVPQAAKLNYNFRNSNPVSKFNNNAIQRLQLRKP